MSTLKSTCQTTQRNIVEVPIEYIKTANQVFVDRERLEAELVAYREINMIQAVIISNSDTIIKKLELNITNLNLVIGSKEKLHKAEIDILEDRLKKSKRANILTGGVSALFIVLLIIL